MRRISVERAAAMKEFFRSESSSVRSCRSFPCVAPGCPCCPVTSDPLSYLEVAPFSRKFVIPASREEWLDNLAEFKQLVRRLRVFAGKSENCILRKAISFSRSSALIGILLFFSVLLQNARFVRPASRGLFRPVRRPMRISFDERNRCGAALLHRAYQRFEPVPNARIDIDGR